MTELKTTRSDLPDVSAAGINDSAREIWRSIRADKHFERNSSPYRLGRAVPGRAWQGAVNKVINNLWPALNDRYLTEKDQAEDLKLILNRFLRHNQAVVCIRDGGLVKQSTWFVADHWPELTVTPGTRNPETPVVTDEAATATPTTVGTSAMTPLDVFNLKKPPAPAAATEARSEEEMTPTFQEPTVDSAPVDEDEVVKHKCRLDTCDVEFEGVHHRATHEMKHGFRYNEDGTVTQFDPNAPTPDEEETQDLIVKFHERLGKDAEPLNQSQIVEGVRKATPKALSPTIKIVLQVMADEGWFEVINKVEGQKGRVRRFRYLGEPVKRPRKAAKSLAEAVEAKVDALTEESADRPAETEESRVARYHGLFQELMADVRELDTLRTLLASEQRSHADTRQELERVTAERNELQGKLDTLKQVFGTALQ